MVNKSQMDIVIKNGFVIDPKNNINGCFDIGISNGEVVKIADNIENGIKTFDAKGCYVIPGIIDYHAHISPLCEIGIPAEPVCFSSGITTIVDAGSTGCSNYESYRSYILSSKLRIKSYLNVCSAGLVTNSYLENINPKYFNDKKIIRLFQKYPDELVALKIRLDEKLVGDLGLYPLEKTIELAEKIGTRVVVHTTNAPYPQSQIANLLREGDVFTHCYHDFGNSIINEENKVYDDVKEARKRGVIFDAANARFHFSFDVAYKSINDNFLPDIISTDLTIKSLYKKPQIFNMSFLMSKYLNMGLNIFDIIYSITYAPAKLLNMEDKIGHLGQGACADVAIIKIMNREVLFEDWDGYKLQGNKLIKNLLTIRDGEVVFQDIEFN